MTCPIRSVQILKSQIGYFHQLSNNSYFQVASKYTPLWTLKTFSEQTPSEAGDHCMIRNCEELDQDMFMDAEMTKCIRAREGGAM